ncbi:hypothetical protein LWC35_27580 [Pseudonocardia kujensis]|uniref:hypothetical protein n=1 Tax=Pseudonocardia kujensis TaxID=1128675 RepID=UPI001E38F7F9|nr:hypothetical protein [Pseudonocardia kujensis]MCE0766637.1 hypothetical protein [Pseudonocardia kujensis]
MSSSRRFAVDAWPSDRALVLYVPEIEAATAVRDLRDAESAARDLIAVLTGLDPAGIECEVRLSRRARIAPWR